MKLSKAIEKKAKAIRLIAMDVDGVLTGGEIIIYNSGEEVKVWNVKDRMGFHLVHRSGADIKFAWITGRSSRQVKERVKEMGIHALVQKCDKKGEALKDIARKLSVRLDEVAFIGDDLIDIPAFRIAGFSACPADAASEVKREVDYIATTPGGKGVFREIAEIVLKSKGSWRKALQGYV